MFTKLKFSIRKNIEQQLASRRPDKRPTSEIDIIFSIDYIKVGNLKLILIHYGTNFKNCFLMITSFINRYPKNIFQIVPMFVIKYTVNIKII